MELTWILLACGAFFAGFVDAVVGGGGLVQVPALFSFLPNQLPQVLLGTNKVASIVGTTSAATQYARRVPIVWRIMLPGALAALFGSWLGARSVSLVHPEIMRPLVLVMMIVVATYTFIKKDFGSNTGRPLPANARLLTALIGLAVGFYDGFFGPGTGSFFIFLFVRSLHMDFLRASVTAKIMNVATNFSALVYFAIAGTILWKIGAVMACCNLLGAVTGSRVAMRHGAPFVRKMFLIVLSVLIAKLAYDILVA